MPHSPPRLGVPHAGNGARVTLVCGPPCGGKNTYVAEHAQPGDLVVDLDALITALGGNGGHDHPAALLPLAFDARDAVMARLWSGRHEVQRAWVISCAPTRRERAPFRMRGARVVMVKADRDVLLKRADVERPTGWPSYVDNWLNEYETADVDAIVET